MIFHIGERCAGSGYAGYVHRSVRVAFVDACAGLCGILGHIAHTVQAVFSVFRAVNGDQSVKALFRRHLVVAVRTVKDMIKATVRLTEREKIFRQSVTAFHKTAVIQRNPQLTECDNDLCDGFYIRGAPRGIATLAVLHFRKVGQCFICCGFYCFLVLIFCQRLQCHRCHVRIRITNAREIPTAIRHLIVQDFINIELARGLRLCGSVFRNIVIARIQGDKRPDRTVQALPDCFFKIAQRCEQIVACDVRRILANGCQCEDHTGILRIFSIMQHAGAVLNVLLHARIVIFIVIVWDGVAGTGKSNDCPFTTDGADFWCFDSRYHISSAALHFTLNAGHRKRRNGQRKEDGKH